MSNQDTALELEKLRAELTALKQLPNETGATEQRRDPGAGPAAAVPEEVSPEAVKDQLQELTRLLKEELGELPTITCLLVFSLGIVMGRIMR